MNRHDQHDRRRRRRWLAGTAAWAMAAISAAGAISPVPAGADSFAKINGSGSSYVAVAMQQWVADVQTSGLSVNYLSTSSPQGLTQFSQNLVDFAGTEAEYSAIGGAPAPRGYQYVPDVGGAIAVMYNAQDKAGRKVDYLHLSRLTVARIFIGDISTWADAAITADNKGLLLPDQPINVIYRGGQSGTTALFYDFVQHTAPDLFARWAAKNQLPASTRIIQLDGAPHFAPKNQALSGSDQIAQYVHNSQGLWSVAYDEAAYGVVYSVPEAWVQNASGTYVQPYAQNISAALESAHLRPDLSQELSDVYTSTNPLAYPISAYSYLTTQCAKAGDRPTCAGAYTNTGVTATLAKFMRYIACEGQVSMARDHYSPLPPNLSQEMANSIGRMQGTAPEQLTAANCVNPRFKGSLGADAVSPVDPLKNVAPQGGGSATAPSGTGTNSGTGKTAASPAPGAAGAATPGAALTPGDAATGTGVVAGSGGDQTLGDATNNAAVALGGSGAYRSGAPVVYNRPSGGGGGLRPLILLAVLLAMPPLVSWLRRLR